MRILMVASEVNPFVKTGGLADVVYALSKEEAILHHEVSVVLPLYNLIQNKKQFPMRQIASFDVHLSWRRQIATIFQTFVDGITYYFIGNDFYFNREGIYGYQDDIERFAFFNRATLALINFLNKPFDIIHAHDWQAGMLPVLVRENERENSLFTGTKFVLTIHNTAFQGMFDPNLLPDLFELSFDLYENGAVRFHQQASSLKAAIIYCDKITTVSPTHAIELLTPEGSKGLDAVINYRKDDFIGILNGIDYAEFSPETDYLIAKNFSSKNYISGKKACKVDLLKHLGLPSESEQPVFGLVSRLTWQKGLELYLPGMEMLLQRGSIVIALGSGEYQYEQALENLRATYPNQVGIYIGYNHELAHKIYAGSDFFVMPSLFEPCGSGQMIAQRYATLPIVRLTGGLKDSVVIYDGQNAKQANGFGFEEFQPYWMNLTLDYAHRIYRNKPVLRQLMRNALKVDNTWLRSATKYLELYESALGGKKL